MPSRELTPHLIVTRPALTAEAMRRAVRRGGAQPLSLPGLALAAAPDPDAARSALDAARQASIWIVTSPAAVHFMRRLAPGIAPPAHTCVLAVGRGTARALGRIGIAAVAPDRREDSEGLLALPQLCDPAGLRIALIGAPGGRGLLAPTLAGRGAQMLPVHVYRRLPPHWRRAQLEAVLATRAPAATLLSSAEALGHLAARLPAEVRRRLQALPLIVSSERLAAAARGAGFADVQVAASPAPGALVAAALGRLLRG
ncbi:MAG TPA: uroporphyrinogen-III synthase [Dokdonella sp.]|uniref:uroporphyrinogen-III synthase n=1 Tax=Dokdonella sp. TaxID=2291710 RepID=UPI002B57BAEB|nr:uroporphyrinogen-III synthase [Dokdonella sp.]HUD41856.1 uroporphyrinogen-III synthase [Dokdonella sp.]